MIQKENASYRLLRDLGANGGYLGFYYAAAAIDAVLNSDGFYHQCKWIYNEVANAYHTTPFCVERNIRTVVDSIWESGNRDHLKEIIPYPLEEKPKNAQFIDGLAYYLSEHREEWA